MARTLSLLLAGVLVPGLLVAPAAGGVRHAVPDRPSAAEREPAARAVAERALHSVTRAFHGAAAGPPAAAGTAAARSTRHLPRDLRTLSLRREEFAPAHRRRADALLSRPTARPTEPGEVFGASYAPEADPTSDCVSAPTAGSPICVHFARATEDAPPDRDRDGDGLPDQVERSRDVLQHVWDRVVEQGGYRAPLADTGAAVPGPDGRLDVYLVDLGASLYGYCVPEVQRTGRAWSAYCVLDDDYRAGQFPRHTPLGNLRVTAAHEFFHASQFAYDAAEDLWLMESTATWVEDEIYDGVDDNRSFLSAGTQRRPAQSLDQAGGLAPYGNWIWWRWLTERHPAALGSGLPVLVREVWEAADAADAGDPGTYSMAALARVLATRGEALGPDLARFALANRRPAVSYREGAAYVSAPLRDTFELRRSARSTGARTLRLDHLSTGTVGVVPGRGVTGAAWRLRVDVDLPAAGADPAAVVTVVAADGSVRSSTAVVDRDGRARLTVRFGSRQVRRVELTLSNGGDRYQCTSGTSWSCHGLPLDDDLPFRFTATATR